MKYRIIPFLFLLFTLLTVVGYSQSIIINEIYNSSSTDEWIELLVVQDGLDLRGWDIRDFSGTGTAQSPLVFSSNSLWSSLRSGTIIVVARSENTFLEDVDPSDYTLTIKSNNAAYFSGTVFSIAATSEAVQVRNASQTHVIGVSWGTANALSIPQPKVHFSAAAISSTATAFQGDSVSQITNTASWTQNTPTITRGTGNSTANTAWINKLRARPEGSGTASVSPAVIDGTIDTSLVVTYRRDITFNITNLRVVIPPEFNWSHDLSDVSYSNMTATASISGDTIYFIGIVFALDSTKITIQNVVSPIYTGYYKINIQSGSDVSYGDVAPIPVITVYGAAISIADVKVNDPNGASLRIGDLVTVRGFITVANEFGSPSYITDNSGGMSIYGTIFSSTVAVGDEVIVSGRVTQFNGLNQIEYPTLHSVVGSGNSFEPFISTPSQLNSDGVGGVENYEGRLVRLNGVTVTMLNGNPVTTWSANTNYRLTGSSMSDTVQVRIDNNTNLVGAVAPAGVFDVIGVLSQYKQTSPYIGGYQLMPRSTVDVISEGPIFAEYPEETDLTPTSLAIVWKTVNPGTSRIKYGKTTAYELGIIEIHNDTMQTDHYVPIPNLSTATIYNVQAFSTSGADTSFAGNLIVSTTSEAPTTGQINVYFTKSINSSVSSGEIAIGNFNVVSKIVERINNAKRSIDAALYSLSGTAGSTVANALINAKQRGVKVRVIGEYDNHTTAPWTTLSSNGITVIFDLYGSNDGSGLSNALLR